MVNFRTLKQLVSGTPTGDDAVALARRLGLWTSSVHDRDHERRPFVSKFSDLTPNDVSDELAYWTAEFGRLAELRGFLLGQREVLKQLAKSTRASARATKRRAYLSSEAKKVPTVGALNDEVEEDDDVKEVDQLAVAVEVALAHVESSRDATTQYITSLSRQISFLDAQMKGRLY